MKSYPIQREEPSFKSTIAVIAAVWWGLAFPAEAQSSPEFSSIARQANGDVQLQLRVDSGTHYALQSSQDLVDWQNLLFARSTGTGQHIDSAAAYTPRKFYRAYSTTNATLTGDALATDDGEIVIHPINHATLVLGWKSTLIYVDPVGAVSQYAGLPLADVVLVTHEHGDHFSSTTLNSVARTNAILLTSTAVFNQLPSRLRTLARALTNGATAEILGFRVEAIPAYNLTASNHPKGSGNGYLITIGNRRLYLAGDTEDTPEMRKLTDVDVAFLPMNIPYTMTVAKAADAIRTFQPRVVYPYHYRNQDGSFANMTTLRTLVGQDQGVEIRLRKWY